jgi:hypothetical protein
MSSVNPRETTQHFAPSRGWQHGRGPFVVAGLASLPALGALGAAAPGGVAWRWLEFPIGVTAIAAVLGAWAMGRKSMGAAGIVVLGTPVLRAIWAGVSDYLAFRSVKEQHLIPETEAYRTDMGLLLGDGFQCLAPWALGAAFGLLASLSITRRLEQPADGHNQMRAGGWLLGVAVAIELIAFVEPSWIELQTLFGRATVRGTGGWPDTKVLTAALAACAAAVAVGLLYGAKRKVD